MQNISLTLKKENEIIFKSEVKGILTNNVLSFIHDNMKHQIDLEKKTFLRENEDYSFFLDILPKKCEIRLKKEENILQVNVNYAIILQNKNEIEISYSIETQDEMMHLKIVLLGGKQWLSNN